MQCLDRLYDLMLLNDNFVIWLYGIVVDKFTKMLSIIMNIKIINIF